MDEPPILLYDNTCGVCHWLVHWVLRNDSGGRFMFAPLDSGVGRELIARHGISANVDSVIFVQEGRALVRSDAALMIAHEIGGFWRVFQVFRLVPRTWRDAIYDAFARHRSQLSRRLGLRCELPTLEERRRFLD